MDQMVKIAQVFSQRRAAATPEAIEEKRAAGAADAQVAMQSNPSGSFFIMDESTGDHLAEAYAIGWNHTWAAAKKSNG